VEQVLPRGRVQTADGLNNVYTCNKCKNDKIKFKKIRKKEKEFLKHVC
jgi:hypothetical protein